MDSSGTILEFGLLEYLCIRGKDVRATFAVAHHYQFILVFLLCFLQLLSSQL